MSCGKGGLRATAIGRRYLTQRGSDPVVVTQEEMSELRLRILVRIGLRSIKGNPVTIYGIPVVDSEGEQYVW